MEINKKDLKILSLEFRRIANRLINCNYATGMDLLAKFLSFINSNEIISDYIKGYINQDDFKGVKSGDAFSSMGDSKQEEISFTYQYLEYCSKNFTNYYINMALHYGSDSDSAIDEFNHRIILPFVNYIEGYLTEIGIKMGYDENTKYIINISGGIVQLNVAEDTGVITANQN